MNWKTLKIEGISEIERFVTELRLGANAFPYAYCNFRIYEKQNGQYICRSEIAVRDNNSKKFEKTVCEASTQEEAFEITVKNLFCRLSEIIENFTPNTLLHIEDGHVLYLRDYEY